MVNWLFDWNLHCDKTKASKKKIRNFKVVIALFKNATINFAEDRLRHNSSMIQIHFRVGPKYFLNFFFASTAHFIEMINQL